MRALRAFLPSCISIGILPSRAGRLPDIWKVSMTIAQKLRNAANLVNNKALIVGAALSTPVLAFAQAATAFTEATTQGKTDIALMGGALVGVAAVGVGFMIAMKYVKKITRAA